MNPAYIAFAALSSTLFTMRAATFAGSASVPEKEMRRRALAAIDLIDLDGFESASPRELSGAMRQCVGFARVLVVDPDILIDNLENIGDIVDRNLMELAKKRFRLRTRFSPEESITTWGRWRETLP